MATTFREKWLRNRREAQGLTITELQIATVRLGVTITETSLRNWESGGNPTALPFLAVMVAIGSDGEADAAELLLFRLTKETEES